MSAWILCGNLPVENISNMKVNTSENKNTFFFPAWKQKQIKQKTPKQKPIKQIYFILSWVTDVI